MRRRSQRMLRGSQPSASGNPIVRVYGVSRAHRRVGNAVCTPQLLLARVWYYRCRCGAVDMGPRVICLPRPVSVVRYEMIEFVSRTCV